MLFSAKIRLFKFLLIFGFCIGSPFIISAQETSQTGVKEIINAVNACTDSLSIEKLYLQTDKLAYTAGDTLWFKAYLFNATYFIPSSKSGIMYVEIANDSNCVVSRMMLPVFNGTAWGQIALKSTEMPSGAYVLRAYTNWMRNFGEDYIFKKSFYINEPSDNDWTLNYRTSTFKDEGKDKIRLSLKLNRFNQTAVGLRELQLRIMDGKRTRFKSDAETDIDGLLEINFALPDDTEAKKLLLTLQDLRKGEGNRRLSVPLILNRPENIDLQFMPEGGNLVAGLPAHIAFKAVNEDGTSANISGEIYDSKGRELSVFSSVHNGMGMFDLFPKVGETYLARITLPDGLSKTYPLPAVEASGISLQVNNHFRSDSCEIVIHATTDVIAWKKTYYLIGSARGVACYGATFKFNRNELRVMVNKTAFPSGIVRFTLAGPDKIALNERIVFIDHADKLNIRLRTDKKNYQQRDSVSVQLSVSDKNGKPVQGTFSLAVTDDSQVQIDSFSRGSILTKMLLTSDLKGRVEEPGYYLRGKMTEQKWQHLDQLLLAQGWVGYNWNDIFKTKKKPEYKAEPEFIVQGKVLNMLNKPVGGSGVTLLSQKPLLIMDTVTNEQGIFTFKNVFPVDTAAFFIQSKNKKNKSFNVGIEMDEFKPPVFSGFKENIMPWYVNLDTSKKAFLRTQAKLQKKKELTVGGVRLQEVIVKAKRIIKDSKNLNGLGEADIIIGQEELEKAGRTTLGDMLEQRVKGFGIRINKSGERYYAISDRIVHLVIDGMETDFFKPEYESAYEFLKYYFDYYDAEEIKGIEVMISTKYESAYRSRFLDPTAHPWEHAFIEITTRSGHGPFVKKAVGTYLYKPLAFTLPKKFYVPRYKTGSTADMTDIRSTVYWNPDIITDKDGKASVSFFTADILGTYSIIIEGSDMAGDMGEGRAVIHLEK